MSPVDLTKYVAARAAGYAYMRRLRAIEDEEERHLFELALVRLTLAHELADEELARAWKAVAEAWDFRRVNDLVAKHNEHYPVEANVPMNPRTGSYARDWRRRPYDAAWILERFPPAAL